jgi:hypothetical protein
MSASPAEILRHLDFHESAIRDEFLAVVRRIVGEARVGEIERLIIAGRVNDIAAALGIDSAALTPVVEAVRNAMIAGGAMESASVRVPRRLTGVRFRFDIRAPMAESWMRDHGARLVTNILADQRNAIRTSVTAALEAGRNPRAAALDIVGRVGAGGRRQGGIIGLTDQQTGFVANARRELRDLDGNYFTRQRRDRRFDSIVRRHITSGQPLSQADIDRITGRYADRLLAYRGEMIGRTEAHDALEAGRMQTYQQAVDEGTVSDQNVERTWKTASDPRVRDSHVAMHNQRIHGMSALFQSPTGALLAYPGDTEHGAGAADVVACRCYQDIAVDWLAQELGP